MSDVSPQKEVVAFAGAEARGEAEGDTLRGAFDVVAEINGLGTAEAGATGAAAGVAAAGVAAAGVTAAGAAAGVAATGAHPAAAATTRTASNEIPRFRTTAL
jgi:hypothetical protein